MTRLKLSSRGRRQILLYMGGVLGIAALGRFFPTIGRPLGGKHTPSETVTPTTISTETATAMQMTPFNASEMERFESVEPFEQRIHELTNNQRQEHGQEIVEWSDDLAYIARVHSKDMALREYFSHESPEGDDVGDRAVRFGLDFLSYGENIYVTTILNRNSIYGITKEIVNSWMESEGHRDIILDPKFDSEGVGIYLQENEALLATQVFGRESL